MVKVLENKLINLDLLPGQEQIDLQRQFREQIKTAKAQGKEIELPEGAQLVESEDGAKLATQQGFSIPKEMLPHNLSEEQRSRATGFGGVVVDAGGRVVSGLTGTIGGVVKGVGDTAGDAVYGLGKTGTGLVMGLADTARAPFDTRSVASDQPSRDAADAEAESLPLGEEGALAAGEPAKRKPRKIELRSGSQGASTTEPPVTSSTTEI